jgi:hypothetical protein
MASEFPWIKYVVTGVPLRNIVLTHATDPTTFQGIAGPYGATALDAAVRHKRRTSARPSRTASSGSHGGNEEESDHDRGTGLNGTMELELILVSRDGSF